MNFFTTFSLVDLVRASNVSLVVIVELVHGLGMGVQNLNVVHIVVSVALLDLIEELETLLQLLVQLNMVDGLFHLSDFLL